LLYFFSRNQIFEEIRSSMDSLIRNSLKRSVSSFISKNTLSSFFQRSSSSVAARRAAVDTEASKSQLQYFTEKRDFGPSYPYSFGSYYLDAVPGALLIVGVTAWCTTTIKRLKTAGSHDETVREKRIAAQLRGEEQAKYLAYKEGLPGHKSKEH